jgi:hypothetical protein
MKIPLLLSILLLNVQIRADEAKQLELPDSNIILAVPNTWELKKVGQEFSMFPTEQKGQNSQRRIHLRRSRIAADSLEGAIQAEIDSITKKWPESSNTREHFKGSVPVKTASGLEGLRADFYYGDTKKNYLVLKYYFFDEERKIFEVCAHIYGDETQFKEFEAIILSNLNTNELKKKPNKTEMATPGKPSD